MLEAVSLKGLLANPRTSFGWWGWTGTNWSRSDTVGIKILCEGAVDVEKAADCLGRTPSSIVHRAIDTGLKIPPHWRDVVTRKKAKSPPRQPMMYPYIMSVRGEHADLLAVNSLVPRGLPDHLRADVCQEIMLAIWMKDTSIEELRTNKGRVSQFIRGARKANYEGGGFALSLDVPMRDGRSWYDVLPDPETL